MKREGRQHGMVRTYPTQSGPRPKLNELTSAPIAGTFARVSTKPTNHSKFTGKCGRRKCDDCHVTPASKSKDKVKGAQKMRSSPEVMITWRVVDALPGFNVSGFKSATAVLNYLDDHHDHHDDDEDVYSDESYDHQIQQLQLIDDVYSDESYDYQIQQLQLIDAVDHGHHDGHEIVEEIVHGVVDDGDDDDDGMSFCEVGFVWQEIEGDESWCFVEEM